MLSAECTPAARAARACASLLPILTRFPTLRPLPNHAMMSTLSTRPALAGARRTSVRAKASTGNWAPGTEKPKYLEGAPG